MTQTSNFSESFKAVQNVGKQCVYRKHALWQIQLENLMLQSVTKILYTSAEDLHQQKKIHEYRAFGTDR